MESADILSNNENTTSSLSSKIEFISDVSSMEGTSRETADETERFLNHESSSGARTVPNINVHSSCDANSGESCEVISSQTKQTETVERREEDGNPDEAKEAEDDGWMDILGSGSLKKKLITGGVPDARPQKADLCTLSYTCELEDGTVVESGDSVQIHMGDYEINQGIDFALALMDKGEEAEILVSPRFGFGSEGKQPAIPPDATLLYKVRLEDVQEEPQVQTLNLTARVEMGLKKKEKGNFWHQRGDYTCAIHCYRRALDFFDDTEIPGEHGEEELRAMLEERLKVYNNLAASQTQIGALDAALLSVNSVLNCEPTNMKALFRKSRVLKQKGQMEECIQVVRLGLEHHPDNPTFKKELSQLLAAQRLQNNRQKELYKKMFRGQEDSGGGGKKGGGERWRKREANNTLKWITVASFTVAVLGALVIRYRY